MNPKFRDQHESRLVERFRQGDENALASLFEMHADDVFAFARHITGSREDAEEVTSEAFLRAFRRAADFRGESAFRTWLFGITRNLCRDRQRQPRLPMLAGEPEPLLAAVAASIDASQNVNLDVRTALEALSEDYQDILILCDVEQWDAREAGEILGRSLDATKSLLYRARRALRDELTKLWKEG